MARPSWSERLFRLLLRVFPGEFRREFGGDMAADFQDQRAAARRRGLSATARVWLRTGADFVRRGPREHFDILQRDVRHALRVLRGRPTLALTTVLTLAIAIGLNAAVFSVVNGVLLRQLPAPDSHRLVRLYQVDPPPESEATAVAPGIFVEWARRATTFDALAFVTSASATAIDGVYPEELRARSVSAGFFEVAGVLPALGRTFLPTEYADDPAAPPQTAVLSHDLWARRFGGRSEAIGSTIRFARGTATVVGVMPPGFFLAQLPDLAPVDCWLPLAPDPDQRRARFGTALGRLDPGVQLVTAQRELDTITADIEREYPQDNRGRRALVSPLLDTIVSDVRLQMWALFAAVGCILLIGCANITCLLLAHASGRRQELATRLALGASRARVARELVTESLVLSLAGGLVAGLLAWWSVPALIHWIPAGLPRVTEIAVDHRVWAFALVVSTAVGVGCGLAASLSFRRHHAHLTTRAASAARSSRGQHVKQALIVGNVALAVVLVIAASLLVRTMRAVEALDLGFAPEHAVSIGLNPDFRNGLERLNQFDSDIIARIQALPGVVAAGIGSRPLMNGRGLGMGISLPGPAPVDVALLADFITDGYLDALGGRLLDGRPFVAADGADAPRVALLNDSAARQLFAGNRAVGQTLLVGKSHATVVGVVADVRRTGLEVHPQPTVYFPSVQQRSRFNNLVIRTTGDPAGVVPAVRTILREIDPVQALSRIHVLDELLDDAKAPRRFAMQLVGGFSLLAVLLAMIGLYGVIAESVAQRVPEIGIRMALGATSARITQMVLTRSALMVAAGLAIGLAGAVALRGLMGRFVFGVEAGDPVSYTVACGLLLAAAFCASLIPARRAAAIDPLQALRRE